MTDEPKFTPVHGSRMLHSANMYTREMSIQVDAARVGVILRVLDDRMSMSVDIDPAIARLLAAELVAAAEALDAAQGAQP